CVSANRKRMDAESSSDALRAELARAQEDHADALAAVQRTSAENLQNAEERWKADKQQLQAKHAARVTDAYQQFTEIVENGRKALGYIDELEAKLKSGQALSSEEIERLGAIAGGLDQLRTQYRKPMQEFTELGDYFEREANRTIETPETPRFKRLRKLVSRNYREQLRQYELQVEQKKAFAQAHARFSVAYRKAQTQMDVIGKGMAAQAQRIYALAGEKQQRYDEFEDFFRKSRQAISIHLDVIDLDPSVDIPF
ncbi:unnamed protein product, partial [marine sediment metagenome]